MITVTKQLSYTKFVIDRFSGLAQFDHINPDQIVNCNNLTLSSVQFKTLKNHAKEINIVHYDQVIDLLLYMISKVNASKNLLSS
jgi:hypothetical protein